MLSRKGKAQVRGYFGHFHGLIIFLKARVVYIYITSGNCGMYCTTYIKISLRHWVKHS